MPSGGGISGPQSGRGVDEVYVAGGEVVDASGNEDAGGLGHGRDDGLGAGEVAHDDGNVEASAEVELGFEQSLGG